MFLNAGYELRRSLLALIFPALSQRFLSQWKPPDETKDGETVTMSQCRPFAKATNLEDFTASKKREKR